MYWCDYKRGRLPNGVLDRSFLSRRTSTHKVKFRCMWLCLTKKNNCKKIHENLDLIHMKTLTVWNVGWLQSNFLWTKEGSTQFQPQGDVLMKSPSPKSMPQTFLCPFVCRLIPSVRHFYIANIFPLLLTGKVLWESHLDSSSKQGDSGHYFLLFLGACIVIFRQRRLTRDFGTFQKSPKFLSYLGKCRKIANECYPQGKAGMHTYDIDLYVSIAFPMYASVCKEPISIDVGHDEWIVEYLW